MKLIIILLLGYGILSGLDSNENYIDTVNHLTPFERCVQSYGGSELVKQCDILK